jgi:hypothetical protein
MENIWIPGTIKEYNDNLKNYTITDDKGKDSYFVPPENIQTPLEELIPYEGGARTKRNNYKKGRPIKAKKHSTRKNMRITRKNKQNNLIKQIINVRGNMKQKTVKLNKLIRKLIQKNTNTQKGGYLASPSNSNSSNSKTNSSNSNTNSSNSNTNSKKNRNRASGIKAKKGKMTYKKG